MFCRQCGTSLIGEDRFCTACGARQGVYESTTASSLGVESAGATIGGDVYAESYTGTSSQAEVSNTIVWWLAFAPLLGSFIAGFCAGITHVSIGKFWWTTVALNLILSHADGKHLRKAGYDTSSLGGSWLIPIYLYKRAEMLGQSKSYFTVWVVLFILSFAGVL
jgi:hypothetical protein